MNSGLSLATIEPLNGSNFKKWKENIELYLGLQCIDFCLTEPEPEIDNETPAVALAHHRDWERANRMTKLILRKTMTDVVRGSISDKWDSAKDLMDAISLKFKENEKSEISHLLDQLIGMKYNSAGSVREHIMKMVEITTKLGDLNMPFSDDFVVHQSLRTLPSAFGQLKTTYLAQKDKWDVNELISICVQEEERIKRDGGEITIHLLTKPKWKGKGKAVVGPSGEGTSGTKTFKLGPKKPDHFKKKGGPFKCFFCKKEGHMKKNCQGFKDWMIKKGISKQENTKGK